MTNDYGDAGVRNSDPGTSRDAALALAHGGALILEQEVISALEKAGQYGLTTEEMAQINGNHRDSYSPRMKNLGKKNLVVLLRDPITGDIVLRVPPGKRIKSQVYALAKFFPLTDPANFSRCFRFPFPKKAEAKTLVAA